MYRSLFYTVLISGLINAVPAYAICGNVTLCVKPPNPPNCITYPNYCKHVEPQPTGDQPSYSIRIDGLFKDDLDNIEKQLGVDNGLQPPQQPPRTGSGGEQK